MSHSQLQGECFDCLEVICFLRQTERRYCIWFSNEKEDGFLLHHSQLNLFPSEAAALAHLTSNSSHQKAIKTTTFDLDELGNIMNCRAPFHPSMVLDFWNIASDLAKSMKLPYKGDRKDGLTNDVYEKLFYGNNLPAVNTSRRVYIPQFTAEEYSRLIAVLRDGIALIERSVHFGQGA